jgi:hypothetical protein
MEKLQKKESKNPGNKNSLKSTEKYHGKPLQQNGASRRQNIRD